MEHNMQLKIKHEVHKIILIIKEMKFLMFFLIQDTSHSS